MACIAAVLLSPVEVRWGGTLGGAGTSERNLRLPIQQEHYMERSEKPQRSPNSDAAPLANIMAQGRQHGIER
jgi:hypothetical protein